MPGVPGVVPGRIAGGQACWEADLECGYEWCNQQQIYLFSHGWHHFGRRCALKWSTICGNKGVVMTGDCFLSRLLLQTGTGGAWSDTPDGLFVACRHLLVCFCLKWDCSVFVLYLTAARYVLPLRPTCSGIVVHVPRYADQGSSLLVAPVSHLWPSIISTFSFSREQILENVRGEIVKGLLCFAEEWEFCWMLSKVCFTTRQEYFIFSFVPFCGHMYSKS